MPLAGRVDGRHSGVSCYNLRQGRLGFDTKILRKIVTIRKQDANERMEQEAILELYMSALGMIEGGSD